MLPSKIIATLNNVTTERQLPSMGLNIQQMSFALREFGFGTRIYAREDYKEDFERLLSCYVESGIPIILGLDNRHDNGNIGHAILCIGHEKITDVHMEQLKPNEIINQRLLTEVIAKGLKIYDIDNAKKEFVFVDDNFPVYQKAFLDKPTLHYSVEWHNCKIKHFIVPLYPKIYLEAYEAKNFVMTFLVWGPEPLKNNKELLIRVYLTSCRSYKDKLALNDSFDSDIRELILEIAMPKFIWVAELSSKDLMKEGKADGLILLDATEANINNNKPLIIAAYQGALIKTDRDNGKLENNSLNLPPFTIYANNLRNL